MLEAAADATWETLVRERVFEPLGMEDAGFGDPDAARGHNHDGTPRAPGEGRAWPAAMDPVRAVHASLEDMARLGRALLPGSGFLEPETLGRIRAPLPPGERSDARPGFIIVALAEGPMLFAESGVDDWSALLWVMLDRDVAAFAACNQGGSIAGTATHKAMNEVVSGGD